MATRVRPGIRIRSSDRAVFVGATGTGKTTLAKGLMYGRKRIAVLDPKRTFWLPDSWSPTTYTTVAEFSRHEYQGPAIYRPTVQEIDALCEDFFAICFEEGNLTVYVDEAASVTKTTKAAHSYERCLREGRERNVGTWSATQRPVFLPRVIFTESEHMFIFRLRHPDDRERMEDYTDPQIESRVPRGHQFWYYNDSTQRLKFYREAEVSKELIK